MLLKSKAMFFIEIVVIFLQKYDIMICQKLLIESIVMEK